MTIEDKIKVIKDQLEKLKALDAKNEIFGSSSHLYSVGSVLTDPEICNFETKYKITLPEEYRLFLLKVGNGGAGPYYGLETLEDSLYADLDYKRAGEFVDPSVPFPFDSPWNMDYKCDYDNEEEYEEFAAEYYSEKWETGILRICNFGCGVSLNLVVNGVEKGNIWVDDRGNDGGIYPDPYFEQEDRTTFLSWYLLWLEKSLKELKNGENT